MAERHGKMLRELHEANAGMATAKADSAEKAKQLTLKEDALKAARSEVAKVGGHSSFAINALPSFQQVQCGGPAQTCRQSISPMLRSSQHAIVRKKDSSLHAFWYLSAGLTWC